MLNNPRLRDGITEEDCILYRRGRFILENLIKNNAELAVYGEDLLYNCHSICRALVIHIPQLRVADGYHFTVEIEVKNEYKPVIREITIHSWLLCPSGSIIDPCPVSIMTVEPIFFHLKGKLRRLTLIHT